MATDMADYGHEQWLECRGRNGMHLQLIIEIQRSHTRNFIKTLGSPQQIFFYLQTVNVYLFG